MKQARQGFQRGSLLRVQRANTKSAWEYRYTNSATGNKDSMYLSTDEFPTRSAALKHLEEFVLQLFATIEIHDGKLEIKEVPDNSAVRWKLRLPRTVIDPDDGIAGYAFAVASTLIKTVSALPPEEFFRIYGKHCADGLMSRINRYKANELLFDEFYGEDIHRELYSMAKS